MDLSVLLLLLLYPACSRSKIRLGKGKSLAPSTQHLCFPVIGDIGGVPYPPYTTPSQKEVAALLAKVTGQLKCSFVLGVGDNFYFDGVSNITDPRFKQTFERTYDMDLPWYMIAGNHDHIKNVTAQIGYTKVSNRWKFPFFYYSQVHAIPDSSKKIQIVMIDTILCWNKKVDGIPESEVQWKWIEDKLNESTSDYLIVAGHHPVLSGGLHGSTECLVRRLKPLLEKHKVSAYFSGHDHNLQHIKENNSDVNYFVSGSGNFVDGRMWKKEKLPPGSLKFENGAYGGFTLIRASDKSMHVTMINTEPKEVWKMKIYPRPTADKKDEVVNGTTLPPHISDSESVFEDAGSVPSNLYMPLYSPVQPENIFSSNSPSAFFYNKWLLPTSNMPQNIIEYAQGMNPLQIQTNQAFDYLSTQPDRTALDFPVDANYQLAQSFYDGARSQEPLYLQNPIQASSNLLNTWPKNIENSLPSQNNISSPAVEKSALSNNILPKAPTFQKSKLSVLLKQKTIGPKKTSVPEDQKPPLDHKEPDAKPQLTEQKQMRQITSEHRQILAGDVMTRTKTALNVPRQTLTTLLNKKSFIPTSVLSSSNVFSMIPEKTSVLKKSIINAKTLDTTEFDNLIFSGFDTPSKKTADQINPRTINPLLTQENLKSSLLVDKENLSSSIPNHSLVSQLDSHGSTVAPLKKASNTDEAITASWD